MFFDIDGTLVPFGFPSIPESTRKALATLRSAGIKTFISTGRHLEWIDNLGDVEFDGYVTVNGGMCLLSDKRTCIYKRPIERNDIYRLVEFVKSHNDIPFSIVPLHGNIFFTAIDDTVRDVTSMLRVRKVEVKPIDTALEDETVQLMVFMSDDGIVKSGLFDNVLTHCAYTSWCDEFSDVTPRDSNKASGIDRMLEYFGIDISETMAFGDGGNDIAMLQHVAIGVAMGNAAESVKREADYVTADADCDGIAKALRHFGLM